MPTIGIKFFNELFQIAFFKGLTHGSKDLTDLGSANVAFLFLIEHIEIFTEFYKDSVIYLISKTGADSTYAQFDQR